jgi:hypothetical protein
MKQNRQAQQDQAANALKAQEIQTIDEREKMKIASNERLKMMELNSRGADEAAKARRTNLQAMAESQSHQADMLGTIAKARADEQTNVLKQRELASRTLLNIQKAQHPPVPPARGPF